MICKKKIWMCNVIYWYWMNVLVFYLRRNENFCMYIYKWVLKVYICCGKSGWGKEIIVILFMKLDSEKKNIFL